MRSDKKPAPKRERTVIDNVLRKKILVGNVDEGLTALQLAHKYRMCFNSVMKILKDEKYVYGFWERISLNPRIPAAHVSKASEKAEAKKRNDLTPSDRMKELSVDAIEIAEMICKRMKDLLSDPDQSISPAQLTSFMQSISAYSIKKADGSGKVKDDDKPLSSSAQFTIFKNQISK